MRTQYYKWLCQKVFIPQRRHYKRLVKYLHSIPFTYTVPLDRNREEDGFELRRRFAYEYAYPINCLYDDMVDEPCSVLEMMVALAIRCEEHIMEDLELGDRTEKWFWIMIDSSGLNTLTDLS